MADPHKNFASSTVLTAPSPATSGTSLVLASGDGALFPQPTTDGAFNVVICPVGTVPTAANAEIARCTARATDTLTITRAQEGTSARTVIVGDQVYLPATKKSLNDIEPGQWAPADHGLIAWSYDPSMGVNSTIVATAGTTQIVRLKVPVASSITNVHLYIVTAGATLTAGQCFAGLFNSAGTLLGTTADQSTLWLSVAERKMALAGGPYAVPPGDVFVGFFANGTTLPTFLRASGAAGIHNMNLASASSRYATADTGRTTTFASPMGALTPVNVSWWAAVS